MGISQTDIQPIVDQIVEKFSPRRIFLFGSQAYGQPTAASDVDILIVMEIDESALHAAARISEARGAHRASRHHCPYARGVCVSARRSQLVRVSHSTERYRLV